jgi:hypothetical protein
MAGLTSPLRPGCAAYRERRYHELWDLEEDCLSVWILRLGLLLLLGCAAPSAGPASDAGPQGGEPVGRSIHPRSGHFTYQLGSIERDGDDLRVDFRFHNGTHRDCDQVALRVILLGEKGKSRAVRVPAGAIRAEQTKRLVARVDGVTFRVRDITLELIYALP